MAVDSGENKSIMQDHSWSDAGSYLFCSVRMRGNHDSNVYLEADDVSLNLAWRDLVVEYFCSI